MASGITANTLNRVVRNLEGALTIDGNALGSYSRDDISLEVELEYDEPEFGGTIGTLVDSEWIIRGKMTLTVSLKEWAYDSLKYILGDFGYDNSGSSEQFGGAALGLRPYLTDVVLDGVQRGGTTSQNVKVTLEHAVCNVPGITFNETTNTYQAVFETRVDATAPRTLTGKIEIEKPA